MDANPACPAGCGCEVTRLLQGRHRVALRLVIILLSCQRWPPVRSPSRWAAMWATVRCWIHRYNAYGVAGLHDRPRSGWPRLGSPWLGARIGPLLAEPKAWTMPRL